MYSIEVYVTALNVKMQIMYVYINVVSPVCAFVLNSHVRVCGTREIVKIYFSIYELFVDGAS